MSHQFEPLSYKVFGACIAVQRQLGPHCMEVDYQRALEIELRKLGLEYMREAEIPISYDGIEVTRRRVDFVIWDDTHTVILETKACLLYTSDAADDPLCVDLGCRRIIKNKKKKKQYVEEPDL